MPLRLIPKPSKKGTQRTLPDPVLYMRKRGRFKSCRDVGARAKVLEEVAGEHVDGGGARVLDAKAEEEDVVEVAVPGLLGGFPRHARDVEHLGLVLGDGGLVLVLNRVGLAGEGAAAVDPEGFGTDAVHGKGGRLVEEEDVGLVNGVEGVVLLVLHDRHDVRVVGRGGAGGVGPLAERNAQAVGRLVDVLVVAGLREVVREAGVVLRGEVERVEIAGRWWWRCCRRDWRQ